MKFTQIERQGFRVQYQMIMSLLSPQVWNTRTMDGERLLKDAVFHESRNEPARGKFWKASRKCRASLNSNQFTLDACQDPNFFCEAVNGRCKLKKKHAYYTQVQGQMGVSGAKWCDFIVYTKKGISLERIPFDAAYWETLKQKLHTYYFTHFIKIAASEFAKC